MHQTKHKPDAFYFYFYFYSYYFFLGLRGLAIIRSEGQGLEKACGSLRC